MSTHTRGPPLTVIVQRKMEGDGQLLRRRRLIVGGADDPRTGVSFGAKLRSHRIDLSARFEHSHPYAEDCGLATDRNLNERLEPACRQARDDAIRLRAGLGGG